MSAPFIIVTEILLNSDAQGFMRLLNVGKSWSNIVGENTNITTSYKYGNFGTEAELGFNFVQEITNGDLKMKTSTQLLPSLSWLPFWNVAGAMTIHKFEISNQQGYLTIESEMTNYIHRNFRDGMALVPIGVGAREFSVGLIKILEEIYKTPIFDTY